MAFKLLSRSFLTVAIYSASAALLFDAVQATDVTKPDDSAYVRRVEQLANRKWSPTKKMANKVELRVSDNGNGVPKKILDNKTGEF